MCAYSTGRVGLLLEGCDSIEELKEEILPLLQDQRRMWQEKIEQILAERDCTCREFAALCMVSEPAVRKWRKGALPQSRDMYLRIGFAAGYDREQMNSFLMRYGRCPQLSVRSLEDCVCLFVLGSDTLPHTYEAYRQLLDLVREEVAGEPVSGSVRYSTCQLSDRLSAVSTPEEMVRFAKDHAPSCKEAYHRLYRYILAYLHENMTIEAGNAGDRRISFHEMATEARWSSSLRHCISEIRAGRWFPLRGKIISLGLHLNMETSAINRMLNYAGMEPLYPKNPIEAAVIWAINEAVLNSWEGKLEATGSADLCRFVRDVLIRLEIAESEFLIDDL